MRGWYRLLFAANGVAASITLFVCFEVGDLIETLSRLGLIAAVWLWTGIAVLRVETVIHVAAEAFRAMKPWARANEDAAGKPFRAVVAIRGAVVRRDVVVAIGAFRRDADIEGT